MSKKKTDPEDEFSVRMPPAIRKAMNITGTGRLDLLDEIQAGLPVFYSSTDMKHLLTPSQAELSAEKLRAEIERDLKGHEEVKQGSDKARRKRWSKRKWKPDEIRAEMLRLHKDAHGLPYSELVKTMERNAEFNGESLSRSTIYEHTKELKKKLSE